MIRPAVQSNQLDIIRSYRMSTAFKAAGRPILVGSLPLDDHEEAADWVFRFSPEIPLWIQLPIHPFEGMVPQFMPGLPGYRAGNGATVLESFSPPREDFLKQVE